MNEDFRPAAPKWTAVVLSFLDASKILGSSALDEDVSASVTGADSKPSLVEEETNLDVAT